LKISYLEIGPCFGVYLQIEVVRLTVGVVGNKLDFEAFFFAYGALVRGGSGALFWSVAMSTKLLVLAEKVAVT